jgi:CRISPR-associated protein Csb2
MISVRFLDDRYHGLTDNGESAEWPPSPFRLFQALVAGSARGQDVPGGVSSALCWLELLDPPVIGAPRRLEGRPLLTYVPNNVESRARTRKIVRPTLLCGDRLLQYGWVFDDAQPGAMGHAASIVEAARHIRALGWGIDLAIGCGEIVDGPPRTMRRRTDYRSTTADTAVVTELRVPTGGSMQSLSECYGEMLGRYESSGVTNLGSVNPVYKRWGYTAGAARPRVMFALCDASGELYSYPHAKLIRLAGMTRHVAIGKMEKYPPDGIGDVGAWVESFVAGHRPNGTENQERFSYVPLPSIGHEYADAMVRRVMITAPFGCEAQLSHLADQLDGVLLQPEGGGEGPFLERRGVDGVARRYLDASRAWASVTPVILPGHDDHKPAKTIGLIERALRQSGIDEPCEFTWSALPNFPHCLTAHKYDRSGRLAGYVRPKHLEGLTAVHVRLTFECAVAGPLSVGAGRHCGLGVLATMPPSAGG